MRLSLGGGALDARVACGVRLPHDAARIRAVGVDGCGGGWLAVTSEPRGEVRWKVARDPADLIREVEEPARVFVHIPVGLPDDARERQGDPDARTREVLDKTAQHLIGASFERPR